MYVLMFDKKVFPSPLAKQFSLQKFFYGSVAAGWKKEREFGVCNFPLLWRFFNVLIYTFGWWCRDVIQEPRALIRKGINTLRRIFPCINFNNHIMTWVCVGTCIRGRTRQQVDVVDETLILHLRHDSFVLAHHFRGISLSL